MIDGPHPLSVAASQVVVDRDDVNALASQAIERGCERAGQGLAFAGLHLGDAALVQDDAAHHLLVEVAHRQGALHGFARRGEDLGQDLVHGVLDPLLLALAAILGQVATVLQIGMMALVVGGLFRLALFADLVANLVDEGSQLLVGAGLHLGLQLADPRHEGFDAMELAIVRVDEAAQEAKHLGSRSFATRIAGHRPGPRPRRRRPSASADESLSVRPMAGSRV